MDYFVKLMHIFSDRNIGSIPYRIYGFKSMCHRHNNYKQYSNFIYSSRSKNFVLLYTDCSVEMIVKHTLSCKMQSLVHE